MATPLNIYQVYQANPITSNTSTDLLYFGQSPYGITNDAAMTYANFSAQFSVPISFGVIGSSPNADGGSISSGIITLQPADSTHGGLVTSGSQTFGGLKTFSAITATGSILANNFAPATAVIVLLGGSSTLTNTSAQVEVLGGTGGTLILPDATTLAIGWEFFLNNAGSGNVTVETNGGATLFTMLPGSFVNVTAITIAIPAGTWKYSSYAPQNAFWGTSTLNYAGTFTNGTWNGNLIGSNYGGTGVNNGGSLLTMGGNVTFAGAFSTQITVTGATGVTFPTSGTLATTSQLPTPAALTEANDTNVTLTLGGTPSTALLQTVSITAGWTGTLAVGRGGTGVGSVTIAPAATAFAGWDANSNLSANNMIEGYATTATAAATTTLVVGSAEQQYFTGTTTQTVLLPVTSTLVLGQSFTIVNNSTGVVTVQSSGAGTLQAMAAATQLIATVILTSGTTAASWSFVYGPQIASSISTPVSIANGGTGVTSVTTVPAATSFAGWDNNKNLSANNFIAGYTTTVSSATPLDLTVASTQQQNISGSALQTVTLPVVSTLVLGQSFTIYNNASNFVNVKSSGASLILQMEPQTTLIVTCILLTGTTAASWSFAYLPLYPLSIVDGGTGMNAVTQFPTSLTYAAWDSNSYMRANGFIIGYRTVATAAGTTTLSGSSLQQQYFTGTTTQTVVLPNPATLLLGQQFLIVNNSTGVVTVQSSGANTIQAMASSTQLIVTCIASSGSTAAAWSYTYQPSLSTVGNGLFVKEGSNAKQGTVTLSSGVGVVSNSSVTANSRIFYCAQDTNTIGFLTITARTTSSGFTITSSVLTDSGVVAYEIFEPS